MDPSSTRSSRWRKRGCLFGLAVVLALVYVFYLHFNPYDEVSIEVRDVPAETAFVCMIADGADGLVLMPWSLHKVGPFTMHPDGGLSYRWGRDAEPHTGRVRWVRGERVGVLFRAKPGDWRVAWFTGAGTRVSERSLLFGGGAWRQSLHDAANQQLLDEGTLRTLGLNYALTFEE